MLYSLDVGRRFRPPEGRMRRVIFQKSLLRKNSTTRPSEAVKTREPKYFFSFRKLTCPQFLKKWASYDVPPIFGIFSKSGPKRVRYTAFSSRSAFHVKSALKRSEDRCYKKSHRIAKCGSIWKRKTDLEYGMVKDYGYVIIFIGWLIVSSQLRV